MKEAFLGCIFFVVFTAISAQSGFQVSKPEPSFNNDILTVKYDITGCGRGESVDISLILVTTKGDTLRPRYITGDIGKMIQCGLGKIIEWNLGKDKIKIDEDIEVIIKSNRSAPVITNKRSSDSRTPTRGNIILSSVLIPGLGQMKATRKPVHIIFSGVVYGSLGASLYYTIKAKDYKEKYNNATGSLRDQMYNNWEKSYDMSKVFLFGAAGAWAANMIWSAVIPVKVLPLKNLKVSLSSVHSDNFLVSAKWTF